MKDESELEARLSEPTPEVIEVFSRLDGDIVFLGASGKMGPSLARMAKRASDAAGNPRRIYAVARFSSGAASPFHQQGIETVRAELPSAEGLAQLPDAKNVVYMIGRKFGSTGDEAGTWAVNSYLPGAVCCRYAESRIVAFSTGNVYGLSPVAAAGSREGDVPRPVGEYALSALGRERVFEFFSRRCQTPTALIRLNYACDLRYGVLVDLAQQVQAGRVIDLAMGYFNTIWQGDANALTLCAFKEAATPPWVVNVTGPEILSVRRVCETFGRLLKKPVRFTGAEPASALLSNASRGIKALGCPRVSSNQLIEWVADWLRNGGRTLGKPTHFESREGKF
jgi:hypothetical protein